MISNVQSLSVILQGSPGPAGPAGQKGETGSQGEKVRTKDHWVSVIEKLDLIIYVYHGSFVFQPGLWPLKSANDFKLNAQKSCVACG